MAKRFKHRLQEDDLGQLRHHERQNVQAFAATEAPKPGVVALDQIAIDPSAQPRAGLDGPTLQEYAERMSWDALEGALVDPDMRPWEPVTLFFDGQSHWLADGFHRVEAARRGGFERIQATIHQGTLRQAVAFSLGANATHGKRRTNEDKRRAVTRALQDADWGAHSDRQLARMCKVSQPFVSKVRARLEQGGHVERAATRIDTRGRQVEVEVARHNRRPAAAPKKTRAPGALLDARGGVDWGSLKFPEGGFVLLFEAPRWDEIDTIRQKGHREVQLVFCDKERCFALVHGASELSTRCQSAAWLIGQLEA